MLKISSKLCLTIGTLFIFIVVGLIGIVFLGDYLKTRSAAQLCLLLQEIEIGLPLSEVPANLGQPSHIFKKASDVAEWGTIEDITIIEKCDLYMYPHTGIPHKYILVYVDKDTRLVRFVRLKSM